jgi:hypothetical protein
MVVVALWLAMIALAELVRPQGDQTSLCMFRNVTGVPCPTCGATRMVMAAAEGRFSDALAFNPALAFGLIVMTLWLIIRIGFRRAVVLSLPSGWRVALWITLAAIVMLDWGYVIWRDRTMIE